MKIFYLCADHGIPILGRKGCSTHVRETCRSLQEAGHEVFVATPLRGSDVEHYRGLDIVEVPPLKARWLGSDLRYLLYNRRLLRALPAILDKHRPDVMYERYSLYGTTGMYIARRYGLPRILEVNSLLVEEQRDRVHFRR
ncbi:glycosyltransferase, partial [Candidatus Sumerlaeota bacterium]|nr:glycosyltransferase [Candidatus Sumerlaeota bacterium]